MAKQEIIDGQINFNNGFDVNVVEVNKSVKFYAVIFSDSNKIVNIPRKEIIWNN